MVAGAALRGGPRAAGACRSSRRSTTLGDELPALGAHAPARPDRRRRARADRGRAARAAALLPRFPARAPARRSPRSGRCARSSRLLLLPLVSLGLWALSSSPGTCPAAYDYAAAHQLVHDLEHAELRRRRLPRLDAARRPRPARRLAGRSGSSSRWRCSRWAAARATCCSSASSAALPALRDAAPPPLRALAADRPAARRHRDDGRAAARARDLRRAPAPADLQERRAAPRAGAAARVAVSSARRRPRSASSRSSSCSRAAALYGYVRLARTVERPSTGRAALFALGAPAGRRLRSTRRSRRSPSTICSSSICSRT